MRERAFLRGNSPDLGFSALILRSVNKINAFLRRVIA